MGRQRKVYHPATPEFPGDFPLRLERFKDRAGLTWRELARRLRVDACGVGGRAHDPARPTSSPSSTSPRSWEGVNTCCGAPRTTRTLDHESAHGH